MSSKPAYRKSRSSTTLMFRDMIQSLRDRIGLGDDVADNGPSVFEALEPRLLLSANPLDALDAKIRETNSVALLNDDMATIYTASLLEYESADLDLASPAARGGFEALSVGPVVDIIHNAPTELNVGDSINIFVQATDTVDIVSWNLNINGQNVGLDSAHSAGYTFDAPGDYVIFASATNANGITQSKSITLTVASDEAAAPVVSIAHSFGQNPIATGQPVVFSLSAAASSPIESWSMTINGQNVAVDGQGRAEYTFGQAGLYTVVATAEDGQGNVGTQTMVVSVIASADIEAPAVAIGHDAPSILHPGQTVNFTITATDNAAVTSTQFTINGQKVTLGADGKAAYTFTEAGVYRIVATAFDAAGNVGMQTITLHVVGQDVEAPVVTIASDAAGQIHPGQTVTFTVSATDNVAVASRWITVNGQELELDSSYRGQYTFAAPGTYVIVATALDSSGNIGMQTISITVAERRDTEAPTVDIVHNANGVIRPGQQVEFTVVATDNVGIFAKSLVVNGQNVALDADGKAVYTFASAGNYTILAVASDESGNISTKTIVLTVSPAIDSEAPVVTIGHNGTGTLAIGQTVDFTVDATDNVGVLARTLIINGQNVPLGAGYTASYTFASAGTYTVIATAVDAAGNVGTQTLYLTVADNRDVELPVVNITHDGGDTIQLGQTVTFTVTATDNVGIITTIFMINGQPVALDAAGQASYTFASPGLYSVSAMAIDLAGNIGTKTLTIEVTVAQDVESPRIVIDHDSDGMLDAGQKVNFTVTATDNIGVVSTSFTVNGESVALDADGKAFYVFTDAGSYTIIAKAWDAAGNVGTQTITLTVRERGDIEAPKVDIAHNGGTGEIFAGQQIEFIVTATDNVAVSGLEMTINGQKVSLDADGKAAYAFPSAGVYTIVATATDAAGNASSKTLVLTVSPAQVEDTQKPSVSITHNAGTTIYVGNTVEFTVKATDNVGVTGQTFTINGQPMGLDAAGKASFVFNTAGSYDIVATATDAAGNVGEYRLTLTVIADTEAPTVDIIYSGNGGAYVGDTIEFTVAATDNDAVTERTLTVNGQTVDLVDGKGSFTFASAGTYTVVATAKDAAGNVGGDSVSITVTVKDETKPTVTITHNAKDTVYVGNTVEFVVEARDEGGIAGQTFTVNGQPVGLDADGKANIVFDAAGTYEIVATATDASGNTGEFAVTIVVVEDASAPVVGLTHTGGGSAYIGDTVEFTVTATDNDAVTETNLTINGQTVALVDGVGSFTFSAAGSYTFIATAKDAAGNIGTASVTITVTAKDVTKPTVTITHNAKDTVYVGNTVEFVVEARDDNGIVDQTFTINGYDQALDADGKASFVFDTPGIYEIVATATDAEGNTGDFTVTITVVADTEKPVVGLSHTGGSSAYVGDTMEFTIAATDNDAVTETSLTVNGQTVTLVDGVGSFTFSAAGSYTFIATAKDAAGNVGTATVTIIVEAKVEDKDAPVVTLTHDFDPELTPGGFANFKVTATDNVGVERIYLTVNGKEIQLSASGEAQYQFMEYGTYRVEAVAVDAAGNTGRNMVLLLVKSPDAPNVYITHYSGNPIFTGEKVYFTVNILSNNAVRKVELTLNGQKIELNGNNVGTFTFPAAGTYTLQATVEDDRGVVGQDTYILTVEDDVTAPLVEMKHDAPRITYAGTTVEFSVRAVDYMGVISQTFTINGEELQLDENGKVRYTFATAGTYEITTTATDDAGNVGVYTMTLTVIADTTAPTISLSHDGDPKGILTCDIVTFTMSARDNVGVTGMKFTINGEEMEIGENGKVVMYGFPAAGTYEVTVTAWDAAGNEGVRTITLIVYEGVRDTTPPVVSVSHNGRAENYVGNTITFRVNATDNVIVMGKWITISGERYELDASGAVKFTFEAAGTYEVIGYAIDGAGNIGSKSIEFVVVVDTVPPEVDVTHNGGTNILVDDKVTFTVTAKDNDAVAGTSLTINGEEVTLSSSGKVAYTFTETGTYEIIATAWDAAGNEATKTITVEVTVRDETPPVVTLSGAKSNVYIGNTLTFTVKATDNVGVAGMKLTVDGQEVELDAGGKGAFTFTAAGTYEIVATAWDEAGNEGFNTATVTVVEDTVAPRVTLSHNGGNNIMPDAKVTFTINATDNDAVVGRGLTINGEVIELVTLNSAPYVFTAAGTYEVVATAWDAAGNVGSATISVTVMEEDTTAPVLSLSRTGGNVYVGGLVEFTLKATDNVGVTERLLTIDGESVPVGEDGKAYYVFTAAGTYTAVATVKDAAGNSTTRSLTITALVDNINPVVTLTHNASSKVPAGKTIDFKVKATDNVGVLKRFLTINGETIVLDADGNGSYTFAEPGTYTVIASAKDAMGNEGVRTATITVVEDTSGPSVFLTYSGKSTTIYVGNTLDFTMTATDNVGVTSQTLTINGEEVVLVDGKASYTFAAAGSYTVVATAKDAAGNEGIRSVTIKVIEDKTAPTVSITHDAGTYFAVGDTVNFTVSATDAVGVTEKSLTLNGEEVQLDEDGSFGCIFTETGKYTFIAKAKDAAGNVGSKTLTIEVVVRDVVPPSATLEHDAGDPVYLNAKVIFTVGGTDDVGIARRVLTINGVNVNVAANGRASYYFTAPGTYECIATVYDAAGNFDTATMTVVAVEDTEVPVVSLTHNGGGETIAAGTKVEFTVSAVDNDAISTRTLTINGVTVGLNGNGVGSYIFTEAGTYTIIAKATDRSKNASEMEITLTVL